MRVYVYYIPRQYKKHTSTFITGINFGIQKLFKIRKSTIKNLHYYTLEKKT